MVVVGVAGGAAHFGVELYDALHDVSALHCHDDGVLAAVCRGGVGAGFHYCCQLFVAYLLRCVLAAAATGLYEFQ